MPERDVYVEEFDRWAALAGSDPVAFETLRRTLIEDFIAQAPRHRRQHLRCLQWRIDQERARAKSPLGACIRLSRMMWERLLSQGGLLQKLQQLGHGPRAAREPSTVAPVLPFRSRPR